jgi:hypothetical protein
MGTREFLQDCADPSWVDVRQARGTSARINTTGNDAVRLLEHLREHGADRAFGPQVQALRQIMVQNYYRDAAGRLRWRTDDDGGLPPPSLAIVSPYDLARAVSDGV